MIVWLVFQLGSNSPSSLSLHHRTSLKDVLTLEHWVLAGDEFAIILRASSSHPPSANWWEVVLLCTPGLFRLLTNTNNQV